MTKGKKNFTTNNPALQYISTTEESTDTIKKDVAAEVDAKRIPKGYKIDPRYLIETRSKRLQIVLQPSLYDKVKAAADAQEISVNSYIHDVLTEATSDEEQ